MRSPSRTQSRMGGFPRLVRQQTLANFMMDMDKVHLPLYKRRVFWIFVFVSAACLVMSGVAIDQLDDEVPPPLIDIINNTDATCEFYAVDCGNSTRL